MTSIVKLVQGSPEWHAHRAQYRNASETAAVLGQSPWVTPYQLWQLRTGRTQQQTTAPMAHGTAMEPVARAAYEQLTGHVMQPLVLVDGDYSASLDGMTLDRQLILEVKCPYKGKGSELWQAAEAGEVPDHYRWQVQHQLMVSGAEQAHLYVHDGTEGILLDVPTEPDTWNQIYEAWDRFMQHMKNDTPPPLTDKDTVIRSDPAWRQAAEAYAKLKRDIDLMDAQLDEAKSKLVKLATHPSESGCGVSVTRFWRTGNVDYKRVHALQGVDLEQYRGKAREDVRVTVK